MLNRYLPEDGVPASEADLAWWLAKAPRLTWTWARTYADSAPHSYITLLGARRTAGMRWEDYVRLGKVIRTFGEPGCFYRQTNLYLFDRERTYKYWAMWSTPPEPGWDPTLVNRALTSEVYGDQSRYDRARIEALRLPNDSPQTLF